MVSVEASLIDGCLAEAYRYPPGAYGPMAPHAHAEWQIGLSPDRPGRYRWRGAEHVAAPDRVNAMAPGEAHAAQAAVMPVPTRYFMLYVPESRLQARRLTDVTLADEGLRTQMWALYRLFTGPAGRLERESQLALVIARLEAVAGSAEQRTSAPFGCLRSVRDYIEDRLAEDVPLSDLARLAGVTPEHLCRAFRAAYGVPPHAYQTLARVERAKPMLLSGAKAGDVALDLGFYDYSHFARRFERIVGVTPARYQRIKNVQDPAPTVAT